MEGETMSDTYRDDIYRGGRCDGCGAFGLVRHLPDVIDDGLGWGCRYCLDEIEVALP